MKNPKAKGARNELKTVKYYEKLGYRCTKAGGSLGVFDVIAIGPEDVLAIQVKSNQMPPPAERGAIQSFPSCPAVRKLIVVWRDYARSPEEFEWKIDPAKRATIKLPGREWTVNSPSWFQIRSEEAAR